MQSVAQFVGRHRLWFGLLAALTVILVVSLVPASYHAVEYDEYGLDRYTISNTIDYDRVYTNGNWFTGISHEMITFPSTFQYEIFADNALTVFSSEGLEYGLQCSFQWRIRSEAIPNLHRLFRKAYRQQVLNRVIAAAKTIMPNFPIADIIVDRSRIDAVLTAAISASVADMGIDIPPEKFQLDKPLLPPQVRAKFLQAQVQLIANEAQALRQLESVVVQETALLVARITANATRVLSQATAEADRLVSEARSVAFAIEETARQAGLKQLFDALGLQSAASKARLSLLIASERLNNETTRVFFQLPTSVTATLPVA